MKLKLTLKLLALGLLLAGTAQAQQPVVTLPTAQSAVAGNASTTIGVTNTFQSLWGLSVARVACTIQNNGSNAMWVYFGPIAGALKSKSATVTPGQVINCDSNNAVASDQISITGTAGDAFFAIQGAVGIGPAAGSATIAGTVNVQGTGTAGTPAGGVLTIQGEVGGDPLDVTCSSGCSGGTQYAIGAVSGATDLGTASLVVRDDALSALADSEGDWVALRVTSTGALWTSALQSGTWTVQPGNTANSTAWLITGTGGTFPVTDSGGSLTVDGVFWQATQPISGTVTVTDGAGALNVIVDSGALVVTNAGTFAVQCTSGCTSTGGTSFVDDAAFTVAVDSGTPMMGFATTDDVNAGDVGVVAMTDDRALHVNLRADDGSELTTFPVTGTFWQATQPVSGTVTVTDGAGALNVIVDSGSITANAGTNLNTSALALEATLGGVLTSTNFAAAFGTAGTADTQVMSVQGIASMTPLLVGDGTGAFNVIVDSGTLTAVTSITNAVTVAQATAANLNVTVTDGSGALNVILDSGTLTTLTTLTGVTNFAPATGALALLKAEDVASASADAGVAMMAIQRATPADTATDLDYSMLQMSAGRLWVDASGTTLTVASHAVTNAGTFATQATQAGAWTVSGTGTAGSAATGVLTVQGIASMTPLLVGDAAGAFNVIVDSGTITTVSTVTTVSAVTSVTGLTGGNTAFDAAAAAVNPLLGGCYGSAAAPTDVSATNDAVRDWCLLNGARASVLTAAGALIGGDAANGLDVDVTRLSALVAGDADIGNVDLEFAGTAAATDNGASSAQTMRVTIANNSTGVVGATLAAETTKVIGTVRMQGNVGGAVDAVIAAAVPANAIQQGYRSDGGLAAGTAALTAPIICQDSVVISTATSGNVELVALTASETIYVCGWDIIATGTVAVQLIYGTGSACATGETNLTGAYPLVANSGLVRDNDYPFTKGIASNALCIELSAAIQVDGVLHYTKF